MSNYLKYANEASDSYFAGLTETQEGFLKSITAISAFLPATPTPTAHGSVELPSMQEIMEASFAFAQKFLRQQQEFFEKAIAATTSTANATARQASHASSKSKSASAS